MILTTAKKLSKLSKSTGMSNKLKILLCILIFFGLAYFTWYRAFGSTRIKTNIITYRLAAKRILTGINLYAYRAGEPEMGMYSMYVYPPLCAILFLPFALMPYAVSVYGWFVLNFLFLFMSLYLILKSLKLLDQSFISFFILIFISNIGAYSSTLTGGQINILILFLLSSVFYFYTQGQKFLPGIILALAVAIKVTPLLFVGYLLIKREFKILVYFTLGFLLFFFLIPSAVLGWERNLDFLSQWFHGMVLTMDLTAFHEIRSSDQSLHVYLRRLGNVFPGFPVKIVWYSMSLSILAFTSLFILRSSRENSLLLTLKHFALFSCLILLLSKASNHGHFCIWLFPQLFLLILLLSGYYSKKLLIFYLGHIILALIYYSIHPWRSYGFLCAANLVLLVTLFLTPSVFETKKLKIILN